MSTGNTLKRFWQLLRQVTGDDAYERYRAHHDSSHGDGSDGASAHPHGSHCGEALLTRQQFFKQRQEEKWSRVSRCC